MRPLAVCAAAAVCAALAGSSQAAPAQSFAYDRELGVVARATLFRAVDGPRPISRNEVLRAYVRCYRDREAFESAFEQRFGLSADRIVAYYAGGSDVHLRGGTCDNVHHFLGGRHTVYTTAAFAILLHESLHRQGIRNEKVTTCYANEAVRAGARRAGFSEEQALRARNRAFTYTKIYSPPAYFMGKPTCLALARNRDWPSFRDQ
jgi:hypothetical protein